MIRHTLVGADSVVKKLSVPVACDDCGGLFRIHQAIHRAIGEPLRELHWNKQALKAGNEPDRRTLCYRASKQWKKISQIVARRGGAGHAQC
jgi:hypothetical protein